MRVGALAPLGVGTVAWRDPSPRLTIVLCATFEMAADGLELVAPPPPPLGALPGDTGGELIHPDDYVPWKAQADILLVGYAKSAAASTALPFTLRLGVVDKRGWATAGAATHEVPLSSTYLRDAPEGGAKIRVAPVEIDAPAWHESKTVLDGNFSIFNVAPRDQRLPTIDPNMRFVLEGLLENSPRYDVDLPPWWPTAYLVEDLDDVTRWQAVPLVADTLLADVDAERLTITWRANLARPAPDVMFVLATADHPLAPEDLQRRLGQAHWTTALSMNDEEEEEEEAEPPTDRGSSRYREPEATGELDIATLRSLLDARPMPFAEFDDESTRTGVPAPSWDELRSMVDDEVTTTGEAPRTSTIPPPGDEAALVDEDDLPTLHPPAPEVTTVGRPVPVQELADAPPPPPPAPPPLPGQGPPRPRLSPDATTKPGLGPPPARARIPTATLDDALLPPNFGFRSREETSTIDVAALRASAIPFRQGRGDVPPPITDEPSSSETIPPPPSHRAREATEQFEVGALLPGAGLPFASGRRPVPPPNPAGAPPAPVPSVPKASPPRRRSATQDAIRAFKLPTLPIGTHGRIRAGLLDGVALEVLLERASTDERTWRLASRQLAIELAREAEEGGRTLAAKLDRAIAEARAKAPAVEDDEGPPEAEMDLDAYAAALAEVDEAEDPAEAVEALGFEPDEWVALRRRWTRRALQDRTLAMELRTKLAAARRSLRRM